VTDPTSTAVVDTPPSVTMSQADLNELLSKALAAGAAQAQRGGMPAVAVQAEVPDDWTERELMFALVNRIQWFDERTARSAYHAVDTHWPADDVPADGA